MSLLLALCGDKHESAVKEVPLSDSAQRGVSDVFSQQEEVFLQGEEIAFDENWLSDGNEVMFTQIPEDISLFSDIWSLTDTSLAPIDTENLEEIRGLALKANDGGKERILVQSFAASQLLTRSMPLALFFKSGTYTHVESSAFRLDDKLVCIVEDGLIKFRSLHNLGRVIDTSTIFSAATDKEVEAFATDYSGLFEIENLEEFLAGVNRNARKYMASLTKSEVLRKHTAQTLQNASFGTKLTIKIQNGKVLMPKTRGEIAELMRFLNDGRYIGPISGSAFITNSRRPVT